MMWYDLVCFLLGYWHDIGWKCISVSKTFALNPVEIVLWKLRVGNWELCLICIWWGLTDVSFELLPRRFPFGQALAEALKKNTSVTSIGLAESSIGDEGVKAFCVPVFQVAAHGVFVASFLEGFVVCSCSSVTFPVSNFCWLSMKWVNFFLTWTHSVWYDLVCFLLGYWHDIGWKCISVSKTFALNPVGIVFRKLRVGNWELCLICIWWGPTDVSFELLPRRFPFGQALAEALKTNVSVTSIKLARNSIGDEGVKAFCVPGFQVAAHGVFVASLLKGFVVCSCSSFAFPVSNFCWLAVKWVNCFLTWTHSVWYDVVCFLLGYWHDIGWKCISVSKTFALNPVGIVVWKLGVWNGEFCLLCISWGLTDFSLCLLPCRFPFGQALAEALKTNTSVTSIELF